MPPSNPFAHVSCINKQHQPPKINTLRSDGCAFSKRRTAEIRCCRGLQMLDIDVSTSVCKPRAGIVFVRHRAWRKRGLQLKHYTCGKATEASTLIAGRKRERINNPPFAIHQPWQTKLAFPPRRRRLPASALMQFASDSRDLLMFAPCRSCSPRLLVADARSDLPKATKAPEARHASTRPA